MAKLKAFKAVRPTRDKAHLVASRPYYTYKPNILEAKLEENPYTFIHIINPEHNISEELRTEPNSPERFKNVRNVFEEFCAQGILKQEEEEALYVYQQTKNGHVYTGVIAGASVEEYNNDRIKKHEATLTEREEMFTNYLDIVGFNAEPVLISHRKDKLIDDLLEIICSARPEYEFCTADAVKHELWVVQDVLKEKLIEAYQSIEATYIADGHHRSASSALLSQRMQERYPDASGDKNFNYILGFLIDETRLTILEFNRLVKTMNGLSPQEVLTAFEEHFEITKLDGACSPENMHEFHCCMDGNWYKLKCKPEVLASKEIVDQIDAEILTKYILSPIFDIKDLKTNKDINFISGEEGHLGVEREIAKGKYKVGFVLYPVTIDQVKAVADENKIMPPKSTWVEPKMRSGLTIYKINE